MNRQERINTGPSTQQEYEDLVDEIATIRRGKVLAYGEDRYNDPDLRHAMLITYSDVFRKYIRIKELVTYGNLLDQTHDGETLEEAFMDLANYAIMGAQLLRRHRNLYSTGETSEEPETVINVLAEAKNPENPLRKIDQIAVVVPNPIMAQTVLSVVTGKSLEKGSSLEWSLDRVTAKGTVYGKPCQNTATLLFNYEVMKGGLEFEVLDYDEGSPNWLSSKEKRSGISHLGMHVDDLEDIKTKLLNFNFKIAQEVKTLTHTNPRIAGQRWYHYCIFETEHVLGFDLKLIQRLSSKPGAVSE